MQASAPLTPGFLRRMTLPTKTIDATISLISGASKHLNHMDGNVIIIVIYESVAEAEVVQYFSRFNECLGGKVVGVFAIDIITMSFREKFEQRCHACRFSGLKRVTFHDNESRK